MTRYVLFDMLNKLSNISQTIEIQII